MTRIKKSLCILLTAVMIIGILAIAPITASAGAPSYFHPNIVKVSGYWYAWTWSDSDSYWIKGEDNDDTVTFYGLSDKVVFVFMSKDLGYSELNEDSWENTVRQSDDIVVDHVNNHFTATKYTEYNEKWKSYNFTGEWSDGTDKASSEEAAPQSSENSEAAISEEAAPQTSENSEAAISEEAAPQTSENSEAAISEEAAPQTSENSENSAPENSDASTNDVEKGSATIYFYLGVAYESDVVWYAQTWNDGDENRTWVLGSLKYDEEYDDYYIFNNIGDNVVFMCLYDNYDSVDWEQKLYWSDELKVEGKTFTATDWDSEEYDKFIGTWSDTEPTEYVEEPDENSLEVKTSVKSIIASLLKKSSKTVKPLKFVDYDGKLTVVKVKSGTTSSIYKKITVNKSTGAIKFNKGKYKTGTYKIKLKISAAGNSDYLAKTIKKTVVVKLKPKKNNPVKIKTKVKSMYVDSLKKNAKTYRPLIVKNSKGKKTYTKYKKGTDKKIYKKITVNKKNGAITLKKGNYTKGTYKVKIKVTVKGNDTYKSKKVIKAVKIKLKVKPKKKKSKSSGSGSGSSSSSSSSYSSPTSTYNTIICPSCGGTGQKSITIMQTQTIGWNSFTGIPQTIQVPQTSYMPCGTCGGDGRI